MLISLQNVSLKSYNRNIETTFLDSINLDVESGEAVGVIGETGSGKTMLAWTILDQLPIPNSVISGKIFFNNKDMTYSRSELKGREVSMVFQNPMLSLNPIQTIEKQFSLIVRKRFNKTKEESLMIARQ
jgi:ABC-type dipeptide/oligopeptide/nickel transport system ATPase component